MSKLWKVEVESSVQVVVWADSRHEAEFIAMRSEHQIFSDNEPEFDATVLREITEVGHLPSAEWLDCSAYGERKEAISELMGEIAARPVLDIHTVDMFAGAAP